MSDLRSAIAGVLDTYLNSRTNERSGKASRGWNAIMRLREVVEALEVVRTRPNLVVKASAGQGGWAHVPWVALMDQRATHTTRRGVYVIYLFRADMSGVYLTLNQGVTEPLAQHGSIGGPQWLRDNAARLRQRVPELAEAGFSVDPVELRATVASGAHYSASTVAHVLHDAGSLDDAPVLQRALADLLDAYDGLIAS